VLLRAGDLVDELDAAVPGACARLLTELAEILRALEAGTESAEAASRAVALAFLASDTSAQTHAQLALGEAMLGVDNARARQIAGDLLATTELSEVDRGRGWTLLGGSHAYDDVAELRRCLESAFHCYRAAGDDVAAASIARRIAFNLSVTAGPEFDRWLAIASSMTAKEHLQGQGELALVRALVEEARGDWEQAWGSAMSAAELTERVGMHQSLVEAVAVAVEAATATGRRNALPGLLARLGTLIEGHRARLQVTGLSASAPAFVLLGRPADADRALQRAESLLTEVGPNEAIMFWAARGHCASLAGVDDEAASSYGRAELLAGDLGLSLLANGCRLYRLAAQARVSGTPDLREELHGLAAELTTAGAVSLAATARELASTLPY
jgi:hypothetical protein